MTSFKVTFGSFTINGNYTYIGFVGKVSPNGTVHWVTSTIHDGANTMADAGIKGCKLSSDGSSLMVTGYSNEANVAFAGKTFAKSGESDNFVAILDPATGSASHLVGIGGAGLNNFFIDTIPIASKNGSLYAVLGAVNQSAFSDNSTNKLECTAERCCVVVKYTGSTRVWESLLHVASCGFGGIALSEDGSTVFAGGNTLLTALNAADGSEIAKKTVPMEIKDIATLGSTPYVLFRGRGTGTFDSVSIAGPADKTTAMVVKFTLSGSTISASAGTWVGTDEYDTTPYALVPGYDASGNANRSVMLISGQLFRLGLMNAFFALQQAVGLP